ncbi:hypothetical protein BJ742DRAFT_42533 [Cladochytrium replicatum]|nr:hypothetical protein BJ742DRAFT_42533 [Cladochytrium replicatum]
MKIKHWLVKFKYRIEGQAVTSVADLESLKQFLSRDSARADAFYNSSAERGSFHTCISSYESRARSDGPSALHEHYQRVEGQLCCTDGSCTYRARHTADHSFLKTAEKCLRTVVMLATVDIADPSDDALFLHFGSTKPYRHIYRRDPAVLVQLCHYWRQCIRSWLVNVCGCTTKTPHPATPSQLRCSSFCQNVSAANLCRQS